VVIRNNNSFERKKHYICFYFDEVIAAEGVDVTGGLRLTLLLSLSFK
jgi:hypothetical protein